MKIKILITILMFLILTPNVYGVIFGNDSCNAFLPGCLPTPGGLKSNNIMSESLGQMIVDGAGYFLASHSAFLQVLKKVELAETPGIDLFKDVQNNIYFSEIAYTDLANTAKRLEYNQVVIEKLRIFDYKSFAIKKGLNSAVFSTVEKYLANGDVKGVYEKFFNDTAEINILVLRLKVSSEGEPTDLESLWRINQKYSEALLFGQYVAEVFMAIK